MMTTRKINKKTIRYAKWLLQQKDNNATQQIEQERPPQPVKNTTQQNEQSQPVQVKKSSQQQEQKPQKQTAAKRIELGIAEIRNLVSEVLDQETAGRLSPVLANAHRTLVKKGIDSSLASDIVQTLDINSSMSSEEIQKFMMNELTRRLPQVVPPSNRYSMEPTVIALVGPTGVGKTTTIAKLATKYWLQQGRSVAFITADTYRVAAVDQLGQYAKLFESKLEVAGTVEQMEEAMSASQSADIILIDTAGRSAVDEDRIQETASILKVANPTETHLVLSAASSRTATKKAADGFAVTGYDRVIVSKLDETEMLGEMISTLCALNKPLSWFTDGQDISMHFDLARPSKLVESLWAQDRPITH
jgi:flagellar biosynthesis protein FlhF|tara:strand:- start:1029 stop:2111 length:1083 start_codon:yes stop_codon:yes gene_type:complete